MWNFINHRKTLADYFLKQFRVVQSAKEMDYDCNNTVYNLLNFSQEKNKPFTIAADCRILSGIYNIDLQDRSCHTSALPSLKDTNLKRSTYILSAIKLNHDCSDSLIVFTIHWEIVIRLHFKLLNISKPDGK